MHKHVLIPSVFCISDNMFHFEMKCTNANCKLPKYEAGEGIIFQSEVIGEFNDTRV